MQAKLFSKNLLTFCERNIIILADAESEVIKVSPRTGRPPIENPKSASIHIRVTQAEKDEIMEYCKESKKTCLDLIKIGIEADKK